VLLVPADRVEEFRAFWPSSSALVADGLELGLSRRQCAALSVVGGTTAGTNPDAAVHQVLEILDSLDDALEQDPLVLLHDLDRSPLDLATLERVLEASDGLGGTAPVSAITETVKQVDEGGLITSTVSRAEVLRIGLPQAAGLAHLRSAHRDCRRVGDSELLCLVGCATDVRFVAS
jgi:2-C-methyl-D-erythritol 4-phosphate cytidylyltransferase